MWSIHSQMLTGESLESISTWRSTWTSSKASSRSSRLTLTWLSKNCKKTLVEKTLMFSLTLYAWFSEQFLVSWRLRFREDFLLSRWRWHARIYFWRLSIEKEKQVFELNSLWPLTFVLRLFQRHFWMSTDMNLDRSKNFIPILTSEFRSRIDLKIEFILLIFSRMNDCLFTRMSNPLLHKDFIYKLTPV